MPTIQSVNRMLDVLETMRSMGGVARSVDIASALDIPAPTIHRIVSNLAARGYVTQLTDKRYALGPALVSLGTEAAKQSGHTIQPVLDKLANTLGETVNLAYFTNDVMTYVAQATSQRSMRMFTQVGAHVPVWGSGVGKAVLATMSDDAVHSLLDKIRLPRLLSRDALIDDLATCRETGYALDDEEQEVGVRCLAVFVPGAPSLAGLSVSSPTSRLGPEKYADVANTLHTAAHQLTRRWAGSH
ncbi:IclR family transcriptional regulator [Brevibacterium paucivorans]|uniref:IclR family transcriptional regulator n=1 Tax=Brevibacterium paucivorans TaxID=170994 RepID=UPI003219562A